VTVFKNRFQIETVADAASVGNLSTRGRRRWQRLPRHLLPLILAALIVGTRPATANDVIHLKQPASDAVMPVPAIIDDFNGRFIQYRVGTNVRQEQTSNVVGIDYDFSDGFDRAKALFDSGNYEPAEAEWKQALVAEPKSWVQREIRSWLVRTALRQDRWTDAANQFLAIAAEDPDTFHWQTAPLIWAPVTVRDSDRTTARNWLEGDRAIPRLLGASLLLKEPDPVGPAAERALTRLLEDPSKQVSGLARAQLWRNRLGKQPSDNEIANWRSHLNFLPETLRGGPQYLLATAYLQGGQFDRAAAEFLWIPLIYPQHEPTAARASFEAGVSLLRAARHDDAVKVLNETAANFSWSPSGRDAKARLAELQQAP
jgi:TolA-binding protein